MLKPISKIWLAYYVQLLEHPEVLASRHYEIQSYKLGLGVIYTMLMNSFVSDLNMAMFREVVCFTYYHWKRENNREENDVELLPNFIKQLRYDIGIRCKLESDLRGGL